MSSDFILNANIRITCHSTDNISAWKVIVRPYSQDEMDRDWWVLRVGVWEEEGGLTAGTSVTPPTTLPLQGLQAISAIHAAEV